LRIRKTLCLIPGIAALLSAGGLLLMAREAGKGGYENRLLVFPAELGAPRLEPGKLEEFSRREFPLSYEAALAARVSGPRGEEGVTLVGTNSAYPRVLGAPLAEGSFFTEPAWEGTLRQGVLNETAARELFGAGGIAGNRFRLRGEPWLVLGVIRDGDEENRRIYAPSRAAGETVPGFMALLDPARGITGDYAKDRLKTLGIREGAFEFCGLGDRVRLLRERALAAAGILALFLLLAAIPPLVRGAAAFARDLRGGLRRCYPGELLRRDWKRLLPGFPALPALPAALGAILFLASGLLALALPWGALPPLPEPGRELFTAKLAALRFWEPPSRGLFWFSAASSALWFVFSLLGGRGPFNRAAPHSMDGRPK
jgi:hypothetical protein